MGMNKGRTLYSMCSYMYLGEGGGLTGRALMKWLIDLIHPHMSQEVDINIAPWIC